MSPTSGRMRNPVVIPTTYVRLGRSLYLHGAVANQALRIGGAGAPLCASVTLLDGLVLARSAFHHSMNYRSVVIFGRGRLVEDQAQKRRILAALIDRLIPGRSAVARGPDAQELAQTAVLELPLDEASVKLRTGPPLDRQSDLGLDVWAGVIPLKMGSGAPQPAEGAVGSPPGSTLAGLTLPPPVSRGPAEATAREDGFGEAPAIVSGAHGPYSLSDDRRRIDLQRVTGWLRGAYWCPGITRAAVERAAFHSSLVLGAYDSDGTQVGYLRVVSDCTRFAYVMDVFVAGEHRRCGLGRAMVRFALSHPRHRTVARWLLGTRDAHGVYAHEGFTPLAEPHRLMQRTGPGDWQEDDPP
jgi:nitroimidazol reductase NimA-like FMN-containing flavoprotein (pyridoxamine 5'-phosphate oxidase superfamily)/GNAT superfamily N-acetyltransferase